MKRKVLLTTTGILLSIVLFWGSFMTAYGQKRVLATPNPSKEATALYCYMQDIYGKKILSGQMWASWGIDELAYVQMQTGKQPAMRGMDYMDANENNAETQRAIDWWKKGGIPTIMWHWGAPTKGDGYPASQLAIDINRCFMPGTAEYIAFWAELTKKADQLQKLRDANVPVLWRPFHELNGGWFWWGKGNGASNESAANKAALFKRLWTTMFDYYVNTRKLNNLIWVLCYTGSPDGNWFPGNQYVDIAGADTYAAGTGPQKAMFDRTKNSIGGNSMPIAYHECGTPPDPDQCLAQGAMWSWWMEWHTTHLEGVDRAYLKKVYEHDLVLTLDELPNFMTACGGNGCTATALTPSLQINGGAWQSVATANVEAGTKVVLSPQPATGGSWSWTGCGTSSTAREQTLTPTAACTATATFTNTCGEKSSQAFSVTIKGTTCCGSTTSNGYAYCCTNSDPDGDGWGWENNASCIVPKSSADPDKCGLTTGWENEYSASSISLFPSPCKELLTITLPSSSSLSVSVLTLQGVTISKENTVLGKDITLITSHLKPDIYLVKISNGESEVVKKFVKVN